jgi:hypothetical protein
MPYCIIAVLLSVTCATSGAKHSGQHHANRMYAPCCMTFTLLNNRTLDVACLQGAVQQLCVK